MSISSRTIDLQTSKLLSTILLALACLVGHPTLELHAQESLFDWQIGDPNWESPATEYDRLTSDRPHVSEATATVGKGRAQLETGYTFTLENSTGVKTQTHSFAEPLLRVGMFADWFELRLATNYLIQTANSPPGSPVRMSGSDDMYLGAKVAIVKQQGVLPDFTIFPQLRVPTGTGGWSNDKTLPGVNLAYSWALTKRIELECNTVFNRSADEFGGFYTEAFQTANFEFDLGPRWIYFTEFLFFQPWAQSNVAPRQNYFHTGFQYFITPNLQIDFHSAVGLNEPADNLAFTGIGLCKRW